MPYTPHSKEEHKILSWKMLHLAGRQLHHFTNENMKGLEQEKLEWCLN